MSTDILINNEQLTEYYFKYEQTELSGYAARSTAFILMQAELAKAMHSCFDISKLDMRIRECYASDSGYLELGDWLLDVYYEENTLYFCNNDAEMDAWAERVLKNYNHV